MFSCGCVAIVTPIRFFWKALSDSGSSYTRSWLSLGSQQRVATTQMERLSLRISILNSCVKLALLCTAVTGIVAASLPDMFKLWSE